MRKPDFYTQYEMGPLLPWGRAKWFPQTVGLKGAPNVLVNRRRIHALFWGQWWGNKKRTRSWWDERMPRDSYRWDCVNGWTLKEGVAPWNRARRWLAAKVPD